MSVHPCPECGERVSTRALACPHCGAPAVHTNLLPDDQGPAAQDRREPPARAGRITAGVVIVLLVGLCVASMARDSGGSSDRPDQDERGDVAAAEAAAPPPPASDLTSEATPTPEPVLNPDDPSTVPLGYYVGRSSPPAPSPSSHTSYDTPFGASDTPGTMWVDAPNGRSIELRGGETYPAGPEIGRIPDGAAVDVYGACLYGDEIDGVSGHWCSVGYERQRGWAFSPFLSGSPEP